MLEVGGVENQVCLCHQRFITGVGEWWGGGGAWGVGAGIRGVPTGVKLSAAGRHPPYTIRRYILHGIIPVGVTLAPPLSHKAI